MYVSHIFLNILIFKRDTDMHDAMDHEYSRIVESVDWENPVEYVQQLRDLASAGHKESMNFLAILLGDIDKYKFKDEIIELLERSHSLGSVVAANTLSIQYQEWGETEESRKWKLVAAEREV